MPKDSAGIKYVSISEILLVLQASDQADSLAISCNCVKYAAPTTLAKGNKKEWFAHKELNFMLIHHMSLATSEK